MSASTTLFYYKICNISSRPKFQFVVPPSGGSVGRRSVPWPQTIPTKGGTTNRAFHSFKASQRDMKAPALLFIVRVNGYPRGRRGRYFGFWRTNAATCRIEPLPADSFDPHFR